MSDRRLVSLIFALLSLVTMTSCWGLGKSPRHSESMPLLSPDKHAAFSRTLKPVIQKAKCDQCHHSAQRPLFASSSIAIAYDAALGKVNFSYPAASVLVAKSQDRHCAPHCLILEKSEWISAIEAWKTAEAVPTGPGTEEKQPAAGDSLQAKALGLLNRSCVGCHGAWGAYQTDRAWTEAGLIVPGKPGESLITSRVRFGPLGSLCGSHAAMMPPSGALCENFTDQDYATISSWIERAQADAAQEEPPPTGSLHLPSQGKPRIGDRFYVKAFLDGIFGKAEAGAITTETILKSVSTFGGPCDPRVSILPGECEGAAVDLIDSHAPIVPSPSSLREGQRLKACKRLVFNDAALMAAIRKATGLSDLGHLAGKPVPTSAQVLAGYHLFFPGAEPPQAAQTKLLAVAEAALEQGKPLDPWRYLLFTLCASPEWQMP